MENSFPSPRELLHVRMFDLLVTRARIVHLNRAGFIQKVESKIKENNFGFEIGCFKNFFVFNSVKHTCIGQVSDLPNYNDLPNYSMRTMYYYNVISYACR